LATVPGLPTVTLEALNWLLATQVPMSCRAPERSRAPVPITSLKVVVGQAVPVNS